MKRRPSPRRALVLNLRRALTKVHRRFDVRDLGDGRVELTCRTCGTVTIERPGEEQNRKTTGKPLPLVMEKHLARWWTRAGANGISGNCRKCLENERDRRYPLPD